MGKRPYYLLRFSTFTAPDSSENFYQRVFVKEHKVVHCSVNENYAAYVVVKEND